ncbi:hypothetical protein CLOM_g24306 [Closterium sp. NIES-68]|nr:hypothetical protein CLOM_g24306 [Closterium sp. NIES-68]
MESHVAKHQWLETLERFAFAHDRAAVVESLTAGSFRHLFFSALQAIEAGDTAEARALLTTLRDAAGLPSPPPPPPPGSPFRASPRESPLAAPKLSSVSVDAAFLGPGSLVRLIQELELRLAVALWDSGDRDACVDIIKKELSVTLNTTPPAIVAAPSAAPVTVPSFDETIEDAEGAVTPVAPTAAAVTAAGEGSGGASGGENIGVGADSGAGGTSALSSFPSALPPQFADHLSLLELTWQQHGWGGLKEGGLAPVLGGEGAQKVPFWTREAMDKKSLQQLLKCVRRPSLPHLVDAVAWELQRLERDEPDAFNRLSLPILQILTPPQLHSLAARFPSLAAHPHLLALQAIQMLPRGMSLDSSAPSPESIDQILSYLDQIQPLLTSDYCKAKLLFARLTLHLFQGKADPSLLLAFLSLIHKGPYSVFPPARPHEEAFVHVPLFATHPSPSDVKEVVAQQLRIIFSAPSFSSSLSSASSASSSSSSSSPHSFRLPLGSPTATSAAATSAEAAAGASAQFPFAPDSREAAALVERALHTWQPLIGQGKLEWSYVALLLAESQLCCGDDPYYPVWVHLYLTAYQTQHAPNNPTAASRALAELTGRCQLDFAAHNRRVWRVADSVHLDVVVKNVPVLAVKVFEVDSLRYLLASPLDTDFSNLGPLDGLKPWSAFQIDSFFFSEISR